jgi:hypothetical protein
MQQYEKSKLQEVSSGGACFLLSYHPLHLPQPTDKLDPLHILIAA